MNKKVLKKISLVASSLFVALTLASCGGGGGTGGSSSSGAVSYKKVTGSNDSGFNYSYIVDLRKERSSSDNTSLFEKRVATINLDSYTDADGFLRKDLSAEEFDRITGSFYVDPEYVKVALYDQSLSITQSTTYNLLASKRLKVDFINDSPVNTKLPIEPSHSEHIVNVMMGEANTWFNVAEDKLPQGLLKNVGEVLVVSKYFGNYEDGIESDLFYRENLDKQLDRGYKIINASYGKGVNFTTLAFRVLVDSRYHLLLETFNKYSKKYPHFDDHQIITRMFGDDKDDNPVKAEKRTLDFLQERVRDKDLLLIKANGNSEEKDIATLINSTLSVYKDDYKDFLKGYITVTAYQGSSHEKEYANHCKYLKDYCIAALDVSNIKGISNIVNDTHAVGTSFATPYVAATAAIVKGTFPFMTNSELQQTILTTAKDIGEAGVDEHYGWGLVQPQSAILGPKQLLRDFYVDLSRNPDTREPGQFRNLFYFYNPIKSDRNTSLIVKNNLELAKDDPRITNASLRLHGNGDDFKGKILVKDGGLLGIYNNYHYADVYLSNNGQLYGNGVVGTLSNKGILDLHDNDKESKFDKIFKSIFLGGPKFTEGKLEEISDNNYLLRSNYQDQSSGNDLYADTLKVYKNYSQGKDGILVLSLGKPLLVQGNANLDGVLLFDNIREAVVSVDADQHMSLIAPVIFAKSFNGKFSTVDTSHLAFIVKKPELFIVGSNNHKDLQALTINLFLVNIKEGASTLSLDNKTRSYATDGVTNLVSLENKIQGTWSAKSFSSVPSLVRKTSALDNFYVAFKGASKEEAKETLLAFSGSEYSRTFRNNQALSAFNSSELWIDHGQEQGFTSSFNLQQALANNNYNQTSNRLALAYGEESYHLLAALNYGSSAWDNPLSLGRSASKVLGLNLVGSYNYQGYNLALGLDYSHHNNKVRRELNILGKAHNFTQELTNDALDLSLLLAKDFNLEFLTFTPYLSLSYQSNRVGAFSEQLSSGVQSFTLGSDAQSYNFISPLLGFKLSKEINHNLSFLANVSYKYLPAGKLQARLKDKSHNIEQSFSFAKDHLFTVKSGLKYHFNDRISLDVKGGLRKLSSYNGWTKEAGVTLNFKL